MRRENYAAEALKALFDKKKIATICELKMRLGTKVERTVFRKLKKLSYLTSYSHGGRYYTLSSIADFDERGLWAYQEVWFSRYGTLTETIKVFINKSEAGYSAHELSMILQVKTREALLCLLRKGDICRQKMSAVYVYFASEPGLHRKQKLLRQEYTNADLSNEGEESSRIATIIFFSQLNEKQRRLYAGLESLKIGYGGNQVIADQFGIDVHTVAKGKQALIEKIYQPEVIRQVGSGRLSIKKTPRNHKYSDDSVRT